MTETTERHCETCYCGRRAPLQGEHRVSDGMPSRARGTISWAEHLECYAGYAKQHSGQDAETLARRGGFGWNEFVQFTGHEPTTWMPR